MKALPKMAPEELDRLRGLARAAWARLHRGDLGSAEHAAAQEEYERAWLAEDQGQCPGQGLGPRGPVGPEVVRVYSSWLRR